MVAVSVVKSESSTLTVISSSTFWQSGNQATIEKCLQFFDTSDEELSQGCVGAAFLQREEAWKRWDDALIINCIIMSPVLVRKLL